MKVCCDYLRNQGYLEFSTPLATPRKIVEKAGTLHVVVNRNAGSVVISFLS